MLIDELPLACRGIILCQPPVDRAFHYNDLVEVAADVMSENRRDHLSHEYGSRRGETLPDWP